MTGKATNRKHRTPSPRLTRRVFVGNRRVQDNLVESVKIVIWKAIGEVSHRIDVTVTGNSARLEGRVTTKSQREAAAVAARSLPWITSVDNRLKVGPAPPLKRATIVLDADQAQLTCA
jgi:osmotically-inducible protein OsmY